MFGRFYARTGRSDREKWFFDPFVPDVVTLRDSKLHQDVTEMPWEDLPTAVIKREQQCWSFHPGSRWHGYSGYAEGYAMVDPNKLTLLFELLRPEATGITFVNELPESREFCTTFHALGAELATAQKAERLSNQVAELQSELTAATAKDIVDTAVAAGKFNTLVKAVEAAGLADTLKGDGPFTVFAPTDEAFAKLPAGTVENLLKPENKEKLKAILTYHVVAGKVMAADVVKLKTAKTVQGTTVDISTTGGKVKVDNANVVKTDIAASNGIIHVIDAVILPKGL